MTITWAGAPVVILALVASIPAAEVSAATGKFKQISQMQAICLYKIKTIGG
jgi:hypothetical protein